MHISKHNSSKKNSAVGSQHSNLTQQYKSQGKGGQSSAGVREGFAFQNMKQFKCQIDHEIAKCLDTLDRQGLKFLKETLRASKLFGLNTQELANTQSIEENLSSFEEEDLVIEKPQEIVVKKTQPIKQNAIIKKVKKPEVVKKMVPTKPTQQNAQEKQDLNQKIIKKLQSLNIKTGKKVQAPRIIKKQAEMPAKSKKVQIKDNVKYIQQEIQQQEMKEEDMPQSQSMIEESIKLVASNLQKVPQKMKQNNDNHKLQERQKQTQTLPVDANAKNYEQSQDSMAESLKSKLQEHLKTQQNQLSKPFCKKLFKKLSPHDEVKNHRQNMDYGIQISKEDEFRKQIHQEQMKYQREVDSKGTFHVNFNSHREEESSYNKSMIKSSDPYMQNLITKINKFSPSKRSKLQKILDKLQDSQNISNSSLATSKLEGNFILPFIPQKHAIQYHLEQKDKLQKSKSRTKLQKQDKATSLKNSLIKKSFNSNVISQVVKKQEGNQESNFPLLNSVKKNSESQNNVLELYDIAKSDVISSTQKKHSNQQPSQTNLVQLKKSVLMNDEMNKSQLGSKLIKINKKKNQITTIVINLMSNNGHNSLVGLNSIQIFDMAGQVIRIDETHLKQSSNKTIKLFSQGKAEGWLANLSNASIRIENINVAVGGIRINNWNKSELQADKQADMTELLLNDQLYWRGQLKGGSYKDNQNYSTEIKITEKHFSFPMTRNSTLNIQDEVPLIKNPSLMNSLKIKKNESDQKNEVCWLQKDDLQKKMKQIEEQQKKVTNIKRVQTIRNSNINFPNESKLQFNIDAKEQYKPINFNNLIIKNNEDGFNNNQSIRFPIKNNMKSLNENDILGTLKKQKTIKRKKQEEISSNKLKEDEMKKQRQQDQQFQKILKGLEQQEPIKKQSIKVEKPAVVQIIVKKEKNMTELTFEQFMKDSLFDQKPKPRKFESNINMAKEKEIKITLNKQEKPIVQEAKRNNKIDIDNLIDELNDVVGLQNNEQTGEQFYIPELPSGKQLNFVFLSNWGHQNLIGINGIQIIDSDGNNIKNLFATSNSINNTQLNDKLFKNQLLTSDEKNQIKFQKIKRISINVTLSDRVEIAIIRIWNYNGHRVHNTIGIKKCHIKLDNNYIFSGEIQSSSGSLEDSKKNCQTILFTENSQILKKIKEKDWLSKIKSKIQEEKELFKTTLQNFFRPPTRNDDENSKKIMQQIVINKKQIKIPKRICFEYDPPQIPQGFVLKFILHNGWGDRFFIGLNGIQIFNEKGENITNKNLMQIKADPSSISKLEGYERDKRIITNLTNGKNNTTSDNNIWLAPFLSDVEKVQKGRANTIIMDYSKSNKISAINFYNYIKTPERGVRQIQIFLDNILLYRGYLRKYNQEEKIIHTTINFTKEQEILEMVNYMGYNEDNLQQVVGLVNEEKMLKSVSVDNTRSTHHLSRPMTGKLMQ